MKYSKHPRKRSTVRRLLILAAIGVAILLAATIAVRHFYFQYLDPVDPGAQTTQLFTVETGASVDAIAQQLEDAGLIQSAWAFSLYVTTKQVRGDLQAGTYSLNPSQSVPEIVAQLTHGKVATDLVTILPGQRLDQIRSTLINDGFSPANVDAALDAATYADSPALVDKPEGASLEGYIYPDSFQKTADTSVEEIIRSSLEEMQHQLTPDLRNAFAAQGLSTYQGIILASIVEKESSNQGDREQIAQVLLKRLQIGMPLQADPTATYGAILAGAEPSNQFESPYNTYLHKGLPPTPISNVSASSLQAVAHPADTDWLYFVASDDGQTHFSRTLEEHEQNTQQFCTELCQ